MNKKQTEDFLQSVGIPKPSTTFQIIVQGDDNHKKHRFLTMAQDEIRDHGLSTFENIDGWIAHYYDYDKCECGAIRRADTVALI